MCKIAVLITSYNRKEKTLTCLKNLMEQDEVPGLKLCIYLVDDNSSDGTTEAVRSHYPSVNIRRDTGFFRFGCILNICKPMCIPVG